MTPILNQVDALAPDAPLVHPDLGSYQYVEAAFSPQPGTNIAQPDQASARATSSRASPRPSGWSSASTPTRRSSTCRMETHVAIVQWRAGDEVTIWSSAQSPFTVRNLFCVTFGLPLTNVRVIIPHVGGGFGGKAGIHMEPLVACLSRKAEAAGRCKFQATREEEFSLLPCRSALTYRIKTGVSRDGKITAQEMTMYWDAGAYADYAVNVTRASAYSGGGSLRHPQRLARRLHDLHQQALRHGLPRLRPRRVLLGPRAPHGAGGPDHRDGPAGVPAAQPAQARRHAR